MNRKTNNNNKKENRGEDGREEGAI